MEYNLSDIPEKEYNYIVDALKEYCVHTPDAGNIYEILKSNIEKPEIEDEFTFERPLSVRGDGNGIKIGSQVQVALKSNGKNTIWSDYKTVLGIRKYRDITQYEIDYKWKEREELRTIKEERIDYNNKLERLKTKKCEYMHSRKSLVNYQNNIH